MKKVVGLLAVFAVAAALSFAVAKDRKGSQADMQCKKNCDATYKLCVKNAKGDKELKKSCFAEKKDCKKNCAKG